MAKFVPIPPRGVYRLHAAWSLTKQNAATCLPPKTNQEHSYQTVRMHALADVSAGEASAPVLGASDALVQVHVVPKESPSKRPGVSSDLAPSTPQGAGNFEEHLNATAGPTAMQGVNKMTSSVRVS